MKVLFIASGNKKTGLSPITFNQGESLKTANIGVNYFGIKGKGFAGYFKNIFILRKYLIRNIYDIYHAHYSDSAIMASLAGAKPLVVSLMGSDVKPNKFHQLIFYLFNNLFWQSVIVKSIDMKNKLNISDVNVIPNGVEIQRFMPLNKNLTRHKISWSKDKYHILFAADPEIFEKNFSLAKEALDKLNDDRVELHILKDICNEEIPIYLNASDIILLTSLWEGSPNVIKEAMACNCPIVSTDVGDVHWVIGNTDGCYISSFEPEDVATKMKLALMFSEKVGRTKGRKRIIELGLDSESVAKKIIDIYKRVLEKRN